MGGKEKGRYVDFVAEDAGYVDETVSNALFDHFFLHGLADDVGLAVAVLLDEVPHHHCHGVVGSEGGIREERGI